MNDYVDAPISIRNTSTYQKIEGHIVSLSDLEIIIGSKDSLFTLTQGGKDEWPTKNSDQIFSMT